MDARLADAGCFIGNRRIEAMLLFVSEATLAEVPKWVVYPEQEWRTVTPAEAGISDAQTWNKWVQATKKRTRGAGFHGEDHAGK